MRISHLYNPDMDEERHELDLKQARQKDLDALRGILFQSLPHENRRPYEQRITSRFRPITRAGVTSNVHETSNKEGRGSSPPKECSPQSALLKEREERARQFRERQNEERQRKLEELKQQALAAQKFREQQEQERKRRIEELKLREFERMQQVAERKKLIVEAERERREAILRKNMEREYRIDAKRRNERSSGVFAFGSSTPRLLDTPGDVGSFFSRRATSTSNMVQLIPATSTRRSVERDMEGNKKRATSAHGLDRKPGDDDPMTQSFTCGVPVGRGRRKNDLFPAVTSREKETRDIYSRPRTKSPGRTLSMTRLDQLAQPKRPKSEYLTGMSPQHQKTETIPVKSMSKSMSHLASGQKKVPLTNDDQLKGGTLEKSKPEARSMSHLGPQKVFKIQPRGTRAERLRLRARQLGMTKREEQLEAGDSSAVTGYKSGSMTPLSPSSRPLSALSHQSQMSTSSVTMRTTVPRKPRPVSIAGTIPDRKSLTLEKGIEEIDARSPKVAGTLRKTLQTRLGTEGEKIKSGDKTAVQKNLEKVAIKRRDSKAKPTLSKTKDKLITPASDDKMGDVLINDLPSLVDVGASAQQNTHMELVAKPVMDVSVIGDKSVVPVSHEVDPVSNGEAIISRTSGANEPNLTNPDTTEPQNTSDKNESLLEIITPEVLGTESVAVKMSEVIKTVVEIGVGDKGENDFAGQGSVKPRITTEEEAKAAIAEKRRLAREQAEREAAEKKRLEEEERRREEEEQKMYERQMEEQRKAEEDRLQRAIEEAQKKEKEEKERMEQEALLRQEREDLEKKTREEAERQRQENEERLRKEEEERQARRKRVEAIMSRTRGKAGSSSPNKTPTKEVDTKDEGYNHGVGRDAVIASPSDSTRSVGSSEQDSERSTPEEDSRKDMVLQAVTQGEAGDMCEVGMDLSPCDMCDPTRPDLLGDILDRAPPSVTPLLNGDNKVNNKVDTSVVRASDKILRLDMPASVVLNNQENLLMSADTLQTNGILDNIKVQNNSSVTTVLSSGRQLSEFDPFSHQTILSNEDSINSNVGAPHQIISLDDNVGKKAEAGDKITGHPV